MNKFDETSFCMLVQKVAYRIGYDESLCVCGVSPGVQIRDIPVEVWDFIHEAVDQKLDSQRIA